MVQFASRMDLLKGSEIRELLKLTAQPDILSFAGGMPAPELFPVEQMMEASIAVLKEHGREALQYSTTEGFPFGIAFNRWLCIAAGTPIIV